MNKLEPYKIFNKVKDSIVVIEFSIIDEDNQRAKEYASGVVFEKNKLETLIITNYHILNKPGDEILIRHNNQFFKNVEIVFADKENDLLLLQLEGFKYKSIPKGKSRDSKIGENVFAIGSPLKIENTLSNGIISTFKRDSVTKDLTEIITTAPITSGSSGGALINEKGELIGITKGGIPEAQLNKAIPINMVNDFLHKAKDNRRGNSYYHNYYIGLCLYENEKYSEAINQFNKCLKCNILFDDKADILFKIGRCFFSMKEDGDCNKAIKILSEAIELLPNPIYYLERAKVYKKIGKNDLALHDYDAVAKSQAKRTLRAKAFLGKAKISKDYQDKSEFIEFILNNTNNNKILAEAFSIKGHLKFEKKELDDAEGFYNKAIEVIANYETERVNEKNKIIAKYNYYLGRVYKEQGKFIHAILRFDDTINNVSVNHAPVSHFKRAYCYWRLQNNSQAMFDFLYATEEYDKYNFNLDDEFWDERKRIKEFCFLGIADCYYRSQDYRSGLRYIDKALSENSNSTEAILVRAKLEKLGRNYLECITDLKLVLKAMREWRKSHNKYLDKMFYFYDQYTETEIKDQIKEAQREFNKHKRKKK